MVKKLYKEIKAADPTVYNLLKPLRTAAGFLKLDLLGLYRSGPKSAFGHPAVKTAPRHLSLI